MNDKTAECVREQAGKPAAKRPSLWQTGALFHACHRFPRKPKTKRVDRLAGILRHGLVAPGCCQDGSVFSDLNIVVTGADMAYDRLVFLHRYGPQSFIYTYGEPDKFFVFVDPAHPVLTPDDMGDNWVILSQDEVYVRERVALENFTGIVVHPADAERVVSEFAEEFARLRIPVRDFDNNDLWQPR